MSIFRRLGLALVAVAALAVWLASGAMAGWTLRVGSHHGREDCTMSGMRRDDVIWTIVITVIAVTINPVLKSIGLLPADVFRGDVVHGATCRARCVHRQYLSMSKE